MSDTERAARLRKVRREVQQGMGAERLDVELLESELARVEAELTQLRVLESRLSGVLVDSGVVVREDLVESVRELVAERDAALTRVARLKALVNEQAEDEGLWFRAQTAPEAYLQRALRQLHAAIEGEHAIAAILRGKP
jgi:hypothetical protein